VVTVDTVHEVFTTLAEGIEFEFNTPIPPVIGYVEGIRKNSVTRVRTHPVSFFNVTVNIFYD
tara:strand:- start:9307 stop:9492 length:186 start_codon:yes stop_codon:yes gene_type:complete